MNSYEIKRREFIQVLMSLPLGYAVGCATDRDARDRESLAKLLLILGPWSMEDRARADEFVGRFLAADQIVGLYLPESGAVIRRLAGRFPDGTMSIPSLELASLSAEEREFVRRLTEQLYSLVEVRFLVSGEPPWGQCLGERTRYTQAPG